MNPERAWAESHPFFKSNPVSKLKKFVKNYSSPAFIYSLKVISKKYKSFAGGLKNVEIFYAQKSNPNKKILKHISALGAGCDTASYGEIKSALDSGFKRKKIMLTGPGKTIAELKFAVKNKIFSINVESFQEIEMLNNICKKSGRHQNILLRINPGFEAGETNRIIGGMGASKFGIDIEQVPRAVEEIKKMKFLELKGIHIFNSSQILDWKKISKNTKDVVDTAMEMEKDFDLKFETLDLGGGFGIPYSTDEKELDLERLKEILNKMFAEEKYRTFINRIKLAFELGRYLTGESGIYLTKVLYTKRSKNKNIVIIDGGIHHLSRPALIGQEHPIVNLTGILEKRDEYENYLVAGPLCTSIDQFSNSSELSSVKPGDILAVLNAGAYGYTESMPLFLSHKPAEEFFV